MHEWGETGGGEAVGGLLLNYLRSYDCAVIILIIDSSKKEFSLFELEDMAIRNSHFQSGAPPFEELIAVAKRRAEGL